MRRTLSTASLGILLATLVAVPPVSSATSTAVQPVRAEQVTGRVAGARVFALPVVARHVAVYWRGHPMADVELAFSGDGAHFDAPVDAGRDEVGELKGGRVTYGAVLDTPDAVAVRVLTDRPIQRLTVLAMADGAATTRESSTTAAAVAATAQPPVLSRAEWGADPSLMTWAPEFYASRKLVVHHTATSNDYADPAAAASQVRAIYYYHAVTQDWGDIGYNFLIDKFGNVYEGRYSREYVAVDPTGDDVNGDGVTAAHTLGWNSGTVGIAMLGTFTDQDVTPAARAALENMLAWESAKNGIDPDAVETFVNPVSGQSITTPNIAGHRDYVATECPGDFLYGTFPALRTAVAAKVDGTTPPAPDTEPPTPPAGLAAVGGVRRVSLSWNPATDNVGVTGYELWRSRKSSSGYSYLATTTTTSYVDTAVRRRATYYYKVRALDAAGNLSAFSAPAVARVG